MHATRAPAGQACPDCRYPNPESAATCALCGHVLRRPAARPMPPEPGPSGPAPERVCGLPAPLFALLAGLLLLPAFVGLPVVNLMAWFFGALTHELGHSLVAWAFGMPAYPAIRLDGHAASIHEPQQLWLAGAIWIGLMALAWRCRRSRPGLVLALAAVLLYPLLAGTSAREVLHLLGGHLGELAFGGVFFWRAMRAGFTASRVEQVLYALVAWALVYGNLKLCFGLLTDAWAREVYAESGSFGLTNDYIRLAEDVLGWPLRSVALGMLLVALVPLPAAIVAHIWTDE